MSTIQSPLQRYGSNHSEPKLSKANSSKDSTPTHQNQQQSSTASMYDPNEDVDPDPDAPLPHISSSAYINVHGGDNDGEGEKTPKFRILRGGEIVLDDENNADGQSSSGAVQVDISAEQRETERRREKKWLEMFQKWHIWRKRKAHVKERVRKGIPESLRGVFWPLFSDSAQIRMYKYRLLGLDPSPTTPFQITQGQLIAQQLILSEIEQFGGALANNMNINIHNMAKSPRNDNDLNEDFMSTHHRQSFTFAQSPQFSALPPSQSFDERASFIAPAAHGHANSGQFPSYEQYHQHSFTNSASRSGVVVGLGMTPIKMDSKSKAEANISMKNSLSFQNNADLLQAIATHKGQQHHDVLHISINQSQVSPLGLQTSSTPTASSSHTTLQSTQPIARRSTFYTTSTSTTPSSPQLNPSLEVVPAFPPSPRNIRLAPKSPANNSSDGCGNYQLPSNFDASGMGQAREVLSNVASNDMLKRSTPGEPATTGAPELGRPISYNGSSKSAGRGPPPMPRSTSSASSQSLHNSSSNNNVALITGDNHRLDRNQSQGGDLTPPISALHSMSSLDGTIPPSRLLTNNASGLDTVIFHNSPQQSHISQIFQGISSNNSQKPGGEITHSLRNVGTIPEDGRAATITLVQPECDTNNTSFNINSAQQTPINGHIRTNCSNDYISPMITASPPPPISTTTPLTSNATLANIHNTTSPNNVSSPTTLPPFTPAQTPDALTALSNPKLFQHYQQQQQQQQQPGMATITTTSHSSHSPHSTSSSLGLINPNNNQLMLNLPQSGAPSVLTDDDYVLVADPIHAVMTMPRTSIISIDEHGVVASSSPTHANGTSNNLPPTILKSQSVYDRSQPDSVQLSQDGTTQISLNLGGNQQLALMSPGLPTPTHIGNGLQTSLSYQVDHLSAHLNNNNTTPTSASLSQHRKVTMPITPSSGNNNSNNNNILLLTPSKQSATTTGSHNLRLNITTVDDGDSFTQLPTPHQITQAQPAPSIVPSTASTLQETMILNTFTYTALPSEIFPEDWSLYRRLSSTPCSHDQLITKDATRTFSNHILFSGQATVPSSLNNTHHTTHGPIQKTRGRQYLADICRAYCNFDVDLGYCQGISFLVATLLMYMESEDAFWVLVCLLQHPRYNLRGLFTTGFPLLNEYVHITKELMKKIDKQLYQFLESVDFSYTVCMPQWFMGLFVYTLPINIGLRIWDILLYEGDKVLIRTALYMLTYYRKELLSCDDINGVFSIIMHDIPNSKTMYANADTFINGVNKITITTQEVDRLRKEYRLANDLDDQCNPIHVDDNKKISQTDLPKLKKKEEKPKKGRFF